MIDMQWMKPAILGALAGAALVSVVGFSWGGWVTGGTATKMASDQAHNEVIAALVPFCVANAKGDSDRIAKLATIKEASSYRRRDAVMQAGWATLPGAEEPNRDLAQACIGELDLNAS